MAEIHYEMSEVFEKQVNAQKEINFQGSLKLLQAHEKVRDENESRIRRKKWHVRNNAIVGRGEFIRHQWKGHVMDINELQVNDS